MNYIKKPKQIEAMHFTDKTKDMVLNFVTCNAESGFDENNAPIINIQTPRGVLTVSLNDYVIKGLEGEFYPCKPDIFDNTYDKVKDNDKYLGVYSKKPVEIEALKLEDSDASIQQVQNFLSGKEVVGGSFMERDVFSSYCDSVKEQGGITVSTLEGKETLNFGDYLIKGVQGEFYPCSEGIFNQTYEKVEG